MISEACAELGERALIYSGANDVDDSLQSDRVMIAGAMNHAAIFPACRAVVHHGGAGTTATGLRAGVPTLILWVTADQPIWAAQVKRLRVGSARRFSGTTKEVVDNRASSYHDPAVRRPRARHCLPADRAERKRHRHRRSPRKHAAKGRFR